MFLPPASLRLTFLAILLTLAAFLPARAQYDAYEGGPIATPAPATSAPIWGKLVVKGNTVTCFYATGGATPKAWTQIGATQTLALANRPFLVGMAITSHDPTAISTGTIDNFSISPASTFKLVDADIGAPAYMGSANSYGGVWTLTGSGYDIWNKTDQFNSQSWLVWSDCTITCRVTSLSSGSDWQKIGIMVRDGYNSGADYAYFCATYSHGVDFQYRLGSDNNPDKVLLVAPPASNVNSSLSIGYSPVGNSSYTLRK